VRRLFALALLLAVGAAGCGERDAPPVRTSAAAWLPSGPPGSASVWAVGDGAADDPASRRVARLIAAGSPDRVLYLGDVYGPGGIAGALSADGDAEDFRLRFEGVYGSLVRRMAPTPGNHEWEARAEGYEDHYARSLDLQEIDAVELDRLMDSLESATREPFRKLKSEIDADLKGRFGAEEVLPWHLSDPFFQSCKQEAATLPVCRTGDASRAGDGGQVMSGGAGAVTDLDPNCFFRDKDLETLTRKTYDNMGLEVRDVIARSDLYERAGKDQHAFCIRIGRNYPYDVRVLANLRHDSYWMDTMLHEFGHAVYDKNINPSLPYLLRTIAHINSTEAIALMMGGLADDPGWLSSIAGVSEEDLEGARERLPRISRADRLVFVRWALVMYTFEKALYQDPDRQDLNSLWWDLVERIQLVNRPPDRNEPDWAAKLHVALAPVYYHNYVLGYLTAAQLRRHLEAIVGGPFYESEIAGRYLQEAIFGPGARDDWRTTVLRATGEELNPAYFVETLR